MEIKSNTSCRMQEYTGAGVASVRPVTLTREVELFEASLEMIKIVESLDP